MKRCRFLFFCFIVLPFFLYAQSSVKIAGRVLDSETHKSLPDANVQVLGSALGAVTDASGRFEIENLLNGAYILQASFMGYFSQQKEIVVTDGQAAELLFQLRPKVLEMPHVQIIAERPSDEKNTNVIVLSQRDIERSQAMTLGDLLKYVPGIDVQESGALGQQTVSIRGSRSNQVLVLLDGLKLNNQLSGDVDLSLVPMNGVERVEIIQGGASAEYGSGAIGGIINVQSAKSIEDKFQLDVKTGSYGFLNLQPEISSRWKDLTFLASYQSLKSNGDYPFTVVPSENPALQQTRSNADVRSTNFYSRVGYTIRKNQFSLHYQNFNSERGNPGRIYYLTPYARSKIRREIIGGDYGFLHDRWSLHFYANVALHNSASSNLQPTDSDLPFGSTPPFRFVNKLTTADFSARLNYQTASWLSNRLGGETKAINFQDYNLLAPNNQAAGAAQDDSYAVFFKQDYRFRLADFQLEFSPAIRFDHAKLTSGSTARIESQWSPQCNVFLSFDSGRQNYFLKAGIGRAFRLPTFADLFYQDFHVQGKPDLLPEKSLNREFGVGGQFSAFGVWRLEFTLFRNTIDDMIVWRLGSYEFFRPYNTDADIFGSEVTLSYNTFSEFLKITAGYTHLKPLNKNDNLTLYDKYLTYRPEHSFKAGLDFEFASWQTSLFYRNVSERFVTEANTVTMPAYFIMDWTAGYSFMLKRINYKCQFAIFNLSDEQFQLIRDMPLPGREWRFGLSVSY